jgi:putative ABC transport system permease protein
LNGRKASAGSSYESGGIMKGQMCQAIRTLMRTPAASITAIAVLSLGISAATSIFSIAEAALLRPLAGVGRPDELVLLQRVQDGQLLGSFGYPDFLDYQHQSRLLQGLVATGRASLDFNGGNTSERLSGAVVSGNYFSLLGVQPAFGRLLTPEDETLRSNSAVLSFGLWQRDFGADPSVIGRVIQLNRHNLTIVGVASRQFAGTTTGARTDIWLPLTAQPLALPYMSEGILENRSAGWLTVFGRLRPGASVEQAESELTSIAAALGNSYPDTNAHRTVRVFAGLGMDPVTKTELNRFFGLLLTAVILLLLIACANVSNLLLARALARQREFAVRLALGAGRTRLTAQLLTEAGIMALVSGLAGLLVAWRISPIILALQPDTYGLHSLDTSPDLRILGFAVLAALFTTALSALTPIWQASRVDLVSALKQGTPGAGRRIGGFRSAMVAGQVTLSIVLLIAAGLVIRTTHHVLTSDQGFDTQHVGLFSIDLTTAGYSSDKGKAFYGLLLERVQILPGILSASLAGTVPPNEYTGRRAIFYPGEQPENIQGREFDPGNLRVDTNTVGPGFLRTLGIQLLRGRDFTRRDRDGAFPVAVVSERLGAQMWPGQDPVGQHLAVPEFAGIANPDVEIIGVARDIRGRTLLKEPVSLLYLPVLQRYSGRMTLVIRTAGEPNGLLPAVIRQVRELDPNVALFGVETMPEHVASSMWQQRLASGLIGLFGAIAASLAGIGLYGLLAQRVAERTREIGIRMALGGAAANIRKMVLYESLRLVLTGLGVGLVIAFAGTRYLASLLYEISLRDPVTVMAACLILGVVALLASEIPSHRATRIDPIVALREE